MDKGEGENPGIVQIDDNTVISRGFQLAYDPDDKTAFIILSEGKDGKDEFDDVAKNALVLNYPGMKGLVRGLLQHISECDGVDVKFSGEVPTSSGFAVEEREGNVLVIGASKAQGIASVIELPPEGAMSLVIQLVIRLKSLGYEAFDSEDPDKPLPN